MFISALPTPKEFFVEIIKKAISITASTNNTLIAEIG